MDESFGSGQISADINLVVCVAVSQIFGSFQSPKHVNGLFELDEKKARLAAFVFNSILLVNLISLWTLAKI